MDASILNAEQAGLFLTCHPNKPYLQEALTGLWLRHVALPMTFALQVLLQGHYKFLRMEWPDSNTLCPSLWQIFGKSRTACVVDSAMSAGQIAWNLRRKGLREPFEGL